MGGAYEGGGLIEFLRHLILCYAYIYYKPSIKYIDMNKTTIKPRSQQYLIPTRRSHLKFSQTQIYSSTF